MQPASATTPTTRRSQPLPNSGAALRQALLLAGLFALLKFVLHFGVNLWEPHIGWGYFRDEMYYILCGQHLDWGYVDHGPIVALQARAAIALFGKSLAGIRMFSALAGAATVFLTGIISWALGGRRSRAGARHARHPVGAGVPRARQLSLHELLRSGLLDDRSPRHPDAAARRVRPRWWIVFGLAGGLGIENKPSMVVFLVALLIGLLITPQRRIVFTAARCLVSRSSLCSRLPNLLWQIHNHFPTLEFIHNGKVDHKNVVLSPLQFVGAQALMLNPLSLPLWFAGVVWLLVSRRSRRMALPRLDLSRLSRAHVRHA